VKSIEEVQQFVGASPVGIMHLEVTQLKAVQSEYLSLGPVPPRLLVWSTTVWEEDCQPSVFSEKNQDNPPTPVFLPLVELRHSVDLLEIERCAAVHQAMKEIHTQDVPKIPVTPLLVEKMEFARETGTELSASVHPATLAIPL